MSRWMWLILILSLSAGSGRAADSPAPTSAVSADMMRCAAFSPYVGQLNPDWGAHPSPELIDNLLDRLIAQTPFRCIMTYGVTNGLEHTFAAARARGLKVIAIIWLDRDIAMNSQSISEGIAAARTYSDTIIKLACGSEVRTRHAKALDGEILRCLDAFREAGVRQPLTTIDTWWEWCDRAAECQPTEFAAKVDWIGANIFPWWENKFSGLYPCTSAEQAADFHIARLNQLRKTYPDKPVVVTEFGWPSGPENGTEVNAHTGQHCGVASPANQALVVTSTLAKLAEKGWSGVVFEAFAENWKPGNEGLFGRYWGICAGQAPYACHGIPRR
ncbi:exo-beta-1,3-glucanase [Methylomonas sp. MED-D]|uniref:exo-beta-1,3-glucanase n=1 Tax=unclassified Methylomonas TaxID=2608980 RepID=UPI0028A4608B|nr:exo-beta-1,3-glucanase [Methylomonas sp. MV1]MDT4329310.1 exo-beta-1,3-glucanase [Methylomonas sp. MV1]